MENVLMLVILLFNLIANVYVGQADDISKKH